MRLDPDCIREVLLLAEEKAEPDNPWVISDDLRPELRYHIRQCVSAGYLKLGAEWLDGSFEVVDLTFVGHQAIAAIRNPAIHASAKREWLSKLQSGLISASANQFVALAVGILQNVRR